MSSSCASVSLGIHGASPTSFLEQHPDQRKSEGVVTRKKLETPLKGRIFYSQSCPAPGGADFQIVTGRAGSEAEGA